MYAKLTNDQQWSLHIDALGVIVDDEYSNMLPYALRRGEWSRVQRLEISRILHGLTVAWDNEMLPGKEETSGAESNQTPGATSPFAFLHDRRKGK